MLVLSRKLDESILIGPGIEVKVLGIRGAGDQAVVRIGIEAPPDVQVLRREVYDLIAAENRDAAASGAGEISSGLAELAKQRLSPIPGAPRVDAPPPETGSSTGLEDS